MRAESCNKAFQVWGTKSEIIGCGSQVLLFVWAGGHRSVTRDSRVFSSPERSLCGNNRKQWQVISRELLLLCFGCILIWVYKEGVSWLGNFFFLFCGGLFKCILISDNIEMTELIMVGQQMKVLSVFCVGSVLIQIHKEGVFRVFPPDVPIDF